MRAVNLPAAGSGDVGACSQQLCFNLFVTSRGGGPSLQHLSDLSLLKRVKLPIFMWELHAMIWRLKSQPLVQIALVWTLRNCTGFQGFTPLRAEPGVSHLKPLSLNITVFFPFCKRQCFTEEAGGSYGTTILIWPVVSQVWIPKLGRPLCAMSPLPGPDRVIDELEHNVSFPHASASLPTNRGCSYSPEGGGFWKLIGTWLILNESY